MRKLGLVAGAVAVVLIGIIVAAALPVGDGTDTPGDPPPSRTPEVGVEVARGIVYSRPEGRRLRLDAYWVEGRAPRPVLIAVHGGAWRSGSRGAFEDLAPRLTRAGWVVFSIDYRLAPPGGRWRYPASSDDLAAALDWAGEHAAAYGGESRRIALLGSSAGGHLGLLLATREDTELDAVAALSPPASLTRLYNERLGSSLEAYLGCPPDNCPDLYEAASPENYVDESDPPVFIAHSSEDFVPAEQSQPLVDALRAASVATRLTVTPGEEHGLHLGAGVLDAALDFLGQAVSHAGDGG